MNPGLKDEASGVMRQSVDALKTTPALLMILLLNIIWLGFTGYFSLKNNERSERILSAVLQSCGAALKNGMKLQSDESQPYKLLQEQRELGAQPLDPNKSPLPIDQSGATPVK